jgi:hypothetical protein
VARTEYRDIIHHKHSQLAGKKGKKKGKKEGKKGKGRKVCIQK